MNTEARQVVAFHYRLSEGGQPIESSHDRGEPMCVLLGGGGLIPGLEKALQGRSAGDSFEVTLAPEEAYGPYRPGLVQRVPKKYFADAARLRLGMATVLRTRAGGMQRVIVRKIGSSVIDVDLNHPLAGKALTFAIEVTALREATAAELEHGHAHGVDGHAHEH